MHVRVIASAFTAALVLPLLSISLQAGPIAKSSSHAVEWQHFRFDKNHTGFQPFETTLSKHNIGSAELLWGDALGGTDSFVYFSSPAVVNGIAYIGTDDGHLFAYSADGCGSQGCSTPLWQSTYIPQMIDSPAVANGLVYIGSQTDYTDGSGKLDAFAADGCGQAVCAPLWQGDAGPASVLESSPAVWKGLVFVGAKNLYAFNAEGCGKRQCKPVWVGKLGELTESSPVIYNGIVFIGANDGRLYAFNATGCARSPCKPLWTADLGGGGVFQSSPAISNGIVFIGAQHSFSAFDANGCGLKSCAPLWQALDASEFFNGSPAIANGRVYMPHEGNINVYAADGCGKALCDPLWILQGTGTQSAIASSPTIANGLVYAGRNTGELLAWADPCDKAMCPQIWSGLTAFGQLVNSSPAVVNGKIYIGSSDLGADGVLYVYGLPQ